MRRLVFASTVVTGDAKGAVLTEETELPVETEYGRSKQEGERMLRESSLEDVIIRPSHVYGPGGWYVEEIVDRIRQPGRFAVVGSGQNWWDVVRVEDVASACVDAAERAPAGSTYHVADDEPIRYYDFVALTAEALGKGPPRRIPTWLARLAAGADPVRAATRSAKSSNARIKSELGWSPRFGPRARASRTRSPSSRESFRTRPPSDADKCDSLEVTIPIAGRDPSSGSGSAQLGPARGASQTESHGSAPASGGRRLSRLFGQLR